MKNGWKWLLIGGGAFILVFALALPFVGGMTWANCGRLGSGGFGPGMMGGGYSMMGFGFLPMIGMVLVPLAVVALVVVGAVALLRSGRPTPTAAPAAPVAPVCANCGQALQTGWLACPHCGQKL
jgi:hypothetical protein